VTSAPVLGLDGAKFSLSEYRAHVRPKHTTSLSVFAFHICTWISPLKTSTPVFTRISLISCIVLDQINISKYLSYSSIKFIQSKDERMANQEREYEIIDDC
jgi:hypothetical protein